MNIKYKNKNSSKNFYLKPIKIILFFLFFLFFINLILYGCSGTEDDKIIKKKLDIIIESDFKSILSELPKESLNDSVYFNICEYKKYKKGIYSIKAVVDFYYLKGVTVKRTIKYRYVKREHKWERYSNEYRFYYNNEQKK
jgi:energy-coupling factor transporter transmembrane protein EcfT